MTDDGRRTWSIAISPNGERLLAGYQSGAVKLWHMNTGNIIQTLYHTGGVFEVAFNSNGNRFVTASQDGTAKIWDTSTGRELLTLYGNESGVVAATFSPDDRYLVTANGSEVKIWDISPTGSQEWLDIYGDGDEVTSVAYSRDGQHLATAGGAPGVLNVWDAASGERKLLEVKPFEIQDIALHPSGNSIAFTLDKFTFGQVQEIQEEELLLGLQGHTDRVTSVAVPAMRANVPTENLARSWRTRRLVAAQPGRHSVASPELSQGKQ